MKRYDIDVQPDRSYYGQGERFEAFAYESGQGDWVRQEDVEDLLALNAQMLEALEEGVKVVAFVHHMTQGDVMYDSLYIKMKSVIAKAKGEKP
jgi:hypothetical protein